MTNDPHLNTRLAIGIADHTLGVDDARYIKVDRDVLGCLMRASVRMLEHEEVLLNIEYRCSTDKNARMQSYVWDAGAIQSSILSVIHKARANTKESESS